MGYNPSKYKDN